MVNRVPLFFVFHFVIVSYPKTSEALHPRAYASGFFAHNKKPTRNFWWAYRHNSPRWTIFALQLFNPFYAIQKILTYYCKSLLILIINTGL